ncbi:hypothetical protein [Phaeovulum sp.]|uniref:hypothetical protein n=1 Tax=Phaeovulum sp. TaxID=2934796 RepID=UPI00272FA409|nr:hypothetical protein [Phaeovulum sp.]MDP1669314.1 hypothetical protein [Phaeovulum sp.]MDZ4119590.1 hypothetical protein [Phaeovulum sp.]
MEQLIVSLVSGAVGGTAVGAVLKKLSFGRIGDAVIGIAGGGIGAYLASLVGVSGELLPGALDQTAGNGFNDVMMSIASGAVGGGVLLVVVGAIKGMMAK